MAPMQTGTIGYPRIGPNREVKKALQSYWSKSIKAKELQEVHNSVIEGALKDQKEAEIDLIGVDGTLYDQILDMCYTLGLVPARFKTSSLSGLDLYFAMARGHQGAHALDMSKYFNTNYHYLVPEVSADTKPVLDAHLLLTKLQVAQAAIGVQTAVPMVVGPFTLAHLANLTDIDKSSFVQKLWPEYEKLLEKLVAAKVPEIQMHEPALCAHRAIQSKEQFIQVYTAFAGIAPINLVTFYDDIGENFGWVSKIPVKAISLDFCGTMGANPGCRSLELLKEHGFPATTILGAGVIDGRNVWADDGWAASLLAEIQAATAAPIRVQTSCSMQHVPLDVTREQRLPPDLNGKLAFARQKLHEMKLVATTSVPATNARAKAAYLSGDIDPALLQRPEPYKVRRELQMQAQPEIPIFPTTTIGSFPQTNEIRKARADFKAGRISSAEHERLMDQFIAHTIGVQEGLGIDVLVHGEPERSDMVEYFGQFLEGFFFTEHGWVQSYGSRYVRPPIIYSDVHRPQPMTVREYRVAQALTTRPVKGMLTGPVTMLNWSFPRTDIARSTVSMQLAQALREEVADLEAAGCKIIQVDEPALREGLPLKQDQWEGYLEWAVNSFRLTTAVAAPATQIVTHLCYSEFEDVLDAIDKLDADVLTIENARSDDAMIRALHDGGYARDIGAGVYDVHSPLVPSVEFMADKIRSFLKTGILDSDPRKIWVNPDCGLKTRGWKEVVPSLKNMVEAANIARSSVGC